MRVSFRSLVCRLPVVGSLMRLHAERRGERDVRGLRREVQELTADVRALRDVEKGMRGLRKEVSEEFAQLREILEAVYDDDRGNRRRLWELRASPEYELAFVESEPLVSVIIPTYENVEGLVKVTLPSVLAQTYRNVEIMVVGDCAPAETAEALAQFDDPRIVYFNRERRGPYPDDLEVLKYVKAGPPFTEGVRRSRGRWIAPFADDDAYRPYAIEALLFAAQAHRYELCYGQFTYRDSTGSLVTEGDWPPRRDTVLLRTAIWHAGLSFIEREPGDGALRRVGEEALLQRMLGCGVRFGMVDAIVTDCKPRLG
jgi:hypothetical protein